MIKATNLKKSILDYAIKGDLSAGFRRNYQGKSALEEIEIFNLKIQKIKTQRENLLNKLELISKTEKDNNRKSRLKNLITSLKNKIKSYKLITPLSSNNDFIPPFDIPSNWAWVKLGEICDITLGQSPEGNQVFNKNSIGENLDFLEFHQGKIAFGEKFISNSGFVAKNANKIAQANSVLLCVRAPVGIVNITKNKIAIGRGLCAIKNKNIDLEFLFFSLQTKQLYFESMATGSTFKAINSQIIFDTPLPLPPLSEQGYIALQLEELLERCKDYEQEADRLEEIQGKLKKQLPKSLLDYAIKGQLSAGFRRNYQGLSALDEIKLFNDKNNKIKQQREILLNKLEILLKNEKNNQRKIKIKNLITSLKNKIKSYKIITPLNSNPDFIPPFDIPSNWAWVKLGEIVFNREQMTPKSNFCYIDIGSINNINQTLNDKETIISAENAPSRARKLVKMGDILYSTVRPYLHNMCIVDRKFSLQPIVSTGFAVMACHSCVFNKYLFFYLMSPEFDLYANDTENAKGIAYPAINDNRLYKALIPLPPLSEQKHIALQLEKLMQLAVRS